MHGGTTHVLRSPLLALPTRIVGGHDVVVANDIGAHAIAVEEIFEGARLSAGMITLFVGGGGTKQNTNKNQDRKMVDQTKTKKQKNTKNT